jgi:hypothetical protein
MPNLAHAILWGFLATIVLTTIEALGRGLGFTRINIPFMLGTIITGNREKAGWIGLAMHLAIGWLFALLYAVVFNSLGRSTWWLGLIMGVVHGLFVLAVLLPMLPGIHPRMASEMQGPGPTPMLAPPGFLVLNYGRATAVVTMIAHAAYGVMMGMGYQP